MTGRWTTIPKRNRITPLRNRHQILASIQSSIWQKIFYTSFLFACVFSSATGQTDLEYLKSNAVLINNPEKLNDSAYNLFSKFQVVMFGEMHGTNESAPIVGGLVDLLTSKGDSVLVGLEIPPALMARFISSPTDSNIYQSEFFHDPPFMDGRESYPWADLISSLNKNPGVKIIFFDVNSGEGKIYDRDSLMAGKIEAQFKRHSNWKIVTLSGNYHNRISNPASMVSVLKRNIPAKICSLNIEYKEGTCMANFSGEGFKKKELGSYPSVYNSTDGYDRYLLLYRANSNYDYSGIYYTRYITAATMTTTKQ
jgi:hypothetical protein